MLDRYLFKAKGYDGEWVTGFLIFNEEGKAFIQNLGDSKEVDETQFASAPDYKTKRML